jgi:hypothetical protein
MVLRASGLGLRTSGLRLRASGLGLRASGFGPRASGLRTSARASTSKLGNEIASCPVDTQKFEAFCVERGRNCAVSNSAGWQGGQYGDAGNQLTPRQVAAAADLITRVGRMLHKLACALRREQLAATALSLALFGCTIAPALLALLGQFLFLAAMNDVFSLPFTTFDLVLSRIHVDVLAHTVLPAFTSLPEPEARGSRLEARRRKL